MRGSHISFLLLLMCYPDDMHYHSMQHFAKVSLAKAIERERKTHCFFLLCVCVGGEVGERNVIYMLASQVYIGSFIGMKRKEELRNYNIILSFLNFLLTLYASKHYHLCRWHSLGHL